MEKDLNEVMDNLIRRMYSDYNFGKCGHPLTCADCPHLPKQFSPKPGDLITVISPRGKSIFIYKSGECKKGKKVYCFAQLHHSNGFFDGSWTLEDKNNDTTDWHLSTKSDRCEFFEAMVKAGYKWNAKKLELKKVEKKWEPEDGDFVANELLGAILVSIFKSKSGGFCDVYANVYTDGDCISTETSSINSSWVRRPATESEIKILIDALRADGKQWNPELKRVEDIKWRAEKGEPYYYSACDPNKGDVTFYPQRGVELNATFDTALFNQGDYHRTELDCKRLCDALNSTIKNFK